MVDLLYIISSLILGGRYTIFPLYVLNQITYSNLCYFYLPLGIIGIFLCGLGIEKTNIIVYKNPYITNVTLQSNMLTTKINT